MWCVQDFVAVTFSLQYLEKIWEQWVIKNNMMFNQDKYKVLHLEEGKQTAQYRIGLVWLGISFAGMALGVLVNKRNMNQQCTSVSTKVNHILYLICRNITIRARVMIIPLYSAPLRLLLEYCVWFWSQQFKSDMEKPEGLHRRTRNRTKGLEDLPCEDRLKVWGLSSLEKRQFMENLSLYSNT